MGSGMKQLQWLTRITVVWVVFKTLKLQGCIPKGLVPYGGLGAYRSVGPIPGFGCIPKGWSHNGVWVHIEGMVPYRGLGAHGSLQTPVRDHPSGMHPILLHFIFIPSLECRYVLQMRLMTGVWAVFKSSRHFSVDGKCVIPCDWLNRMNLIELVDFEAHDHHVLSYSSIPLIVV